MASDLGLRTRPTQDCVDLVASAGFVFAISRFFFCLLFIYRVDLGRSAAAYLDVWSLYTLVFWTVCAFVPLKSALYFLLGWAARRRAAWPATTWMILAPLIHLVGAFLVIFVCRLQYLATVGDPIACVKLYGPFPDSFTHSNERAKSVEEAARNRTANSVDEENRARKGFDLLSSCAFYLLARRDENDGRQETTFGTKWLREYDEETGRLQEVLSFDYNFDHVHPEDRYANLWIAAAAHAAWTLVVLPAAWLQIKRYFSAADAMDMGKWTPKKEAVLDRFYRDRLTYRDVRSTYTSSSSSSSAGDSSCSSCHRCSAKTFFRLRRRRRPRAKEEKTGSGEILAAFDGRPLSCKKPVHTD